MHHWTVLVSIELCLQALQWAIQTDFACLLAVEHPVCEAVKTVSQSVRVIQRDEIDKSMIEIEPGLEVLRQINKVVSATESMFVKHLKKHLTRVTQRYIPQLTGPPVGGLYCK